LWQSGTDVAGAMGRNNTVRQFQAFLEDFASLVNLFQGLSQDSSGFVI
jgi:hypothetical protein